MVITAVWLQVYMCLRYCYYNNTKQQASIFIRRALYLFRQWSTRAGYNILGLVCAELTKWRTKKSV